LSAMQQQQQQQQPAAVAAAGVTSGQLGSLDIGSRRTAAADADAAGSSLPLLRLAPLLSISSGVEMSDVQLAQLELQQEALQQQQQQQGSSWPGSPPSGRASAAGTAAPPSSRAASFRGYTGSGQLLWPQQHQQQQQQQQQLGKLPLLRTGQQASSAAAAAAGAAATGESTGPGLSQATFAVPNTPRSPVQVEVHRLGVFAFKGGPQQQEMVQIVASHLVGRLDITSRAAVVPSRKGQLLQQQEGRIGEAVSVQLPTLAEEYKSQLPERLLASPTRFPLSRGHAYVVTDRHGGGGILHSSDEGFSLPATNSAPVEGSEQQQQHQQHHVRWDTSLSTSGAAAAAGRRNSSDGDNGGSAVGQQAPHPLATLRVRSDITSRASASAVATGSPRGAAPAAGSSSSIAAGRSSSSSNGIGAAAAVSAPLPGGWSAAAAAAGVDLMRQPNKSSNSSSKLSSNQRDHLALTVNSSDAAAVSDGDMFTSKQGSTLVQDLGSTPPCAVAVASVSSSTGGHSSMLRHDSFRSVASADAAVDDEAGIADVAACRSSKSGSSGVASPSRVSEASRQVVAAGYGAGLQQDQQQQQQ
jgi:hypothetical protein